MVSASGGREGSEHIARKTRQTRAGFPKRRAILAGAFALVVKKAAPSGRKSVAELFHPAAPRRRLYAVLRWPAGFGHWWPGHPRPKLLPLPSPAAFMSDTS